MPGRGQVLERVEHAIALLEDLQRQVDALRTKLEALERRVPAIEGASEWHLVRVDSQ